MGFGLEPGRWRAFRGSGFTDFGVCRGHASRSRLFDPHGRGLGQRIFARSRNSEASSTGSFQGERSDRTVKRLCRLELPELSSEEGLKWVLASRAYEVSTELASVALVLLQCPPGEAGSGKFHGPECRRNLFRASDAVYLLKDRGQVALVLDDCKAEDAPRLMERIGQKLKKPGDRAAGLRHCPVPFGRLWIRRFCFRLAESRLKVSGT